VMCRCRVCDNERFRRYYEANRERVLGRMKAYKEGKSLEASMPTK